MACRKIRNLKTDLHDRLTFRTSQTLKKSGKNSMMYPEDATHQNLSGTFRDEMRTPQLKPGTTSESSELLYPSQKEIDALIGLYNGRLYTNVVHKAQALVSKFPSSYSLWNILGAANTKLDNLSAAEAHFKEATKVDPRSHEAFYNLGTNLKKQKKLEEAVKSYWCAITINPTHEETYYNLGNTLQELDEFDKALAAYDCALMINPDFVKAHQNKGTILKKQSKLEEAIVEYRHALAIAPDSSETYVNMGDALLDQGKFDEAISAFKAALEINPNFPQAYKSMGDVLCKMGRYTAALEAYRRSIIIKPDFLEAHNNMGIALSNQSKFDDAILAFKRCIDIKPDFASAHNNMGTALSELGRYSEAICSYECALSIDQNFAQAHKNMGDTFRLENKFEAARTAFKRALKIKADYTEAHFSLSLLDLFLGNLKEGFERYEWRRMKPENEALLVRQARKKFTWDGKSSLNGKKFFIYQEQGFGDIIQFSRYFPILSQKGAVVTFKATPKMHSLLKTLNCNLELQDMLPTDDLIDYEAPIMSLPHILGSDLKTIPSPSPYLYADHLLIKKWSNKLKENTFKIGICWQGSLAKVDIGRSFPLHWFEKISKLPNVELISLHRGVGEPQLDQINFNVTRLGSEFDNGPDAFLDTAAVIMNSDLIITSDTAVAHLAGALGKRVWIALKQTPDWRWMSKRLDSPWYSTATLYRQVSKDDWKGVFSRMEFDVKKLILKETK